MGYELSQGVMYHGLIPPECWSNFTRSKLNLSQFDRKGDVYFYGWVMVELFSGTKVELY